MTIPTYKRWWEDYHTSVEAALVAAFEQAAILIDPAMPQLEAHRLAVRFAENHAGDLLRSDGKYSMSEITRGNVRALVADAIERGDSLKTLKQDIMDDATFSKERAALTARTETARAHGMGSREAAASSGRDGKRWVTSGDPCTICQDNEGDGDIGIDDDFSGGVDTIPQHPNCECNCRYFHRG